MATESSIRTTGSSIVITTDIEMNEAEIKKITEKIAKAAKIENPAISIIVDAGTDAMAEGLTNVAKWANISREAVHNLTMAVGGLAVAWKAVDIIAFIGMQGGLKEALGKTLEEVKKFSLTDIFETMYIKALYAFEFIEKEVPKVAIKMAQVFKAAALSPTTWIIAVIAGIVLLITHWDQVKEAAARAWEAIVSIWGTFTDWISTNITEPFADRFAGLWETIKGFAPAIGILIPPIGLVIAAISALAGGIRYLIEHWDEVKQVAAAVWSSIKETWANVPIWFKISVFGPVAIPLNEFFNRFSDIFGLVKNIVGEVVASIIAQVKGLIMVLQGIVTFLAGVFMGDWSKIWKGVVMIFTGIFEGIIGAVKSVLNIAIELINFMLDGIVNKVNSLTSTFNSLAGKIPGVPQIPQLTAPKIPKLATGAVIPPNAEFLAVLGDQRQGRNLEAPEGLIRQIIREEMAGMPTPQVNLTASGSMGQLVRLMKFELDRESRRKGTNLIGGLV